MIILCSVYQVCQCARDLGTKFANYERLQSELSLAM
jgi:hypothetical protein